MKSPSFRTLLIATLNNSKLNFSLYIPMFYYTLISLIPTGKEVNNTNYKHAYLLPFIFSTFKVEESANDIVKLAFSIFILALISLICFINVFGYFLSLHLLNKYNLKSQYPKFHNWIKSYENITLTLLIIELFIGFAALLSIILINLFLAGLLMST